MHKGHKSTYFQIEMFTINIFFHNVNVAEKWTGALSAYVAPSIYCTGTMYLKRAANLGNAVHYCPAASEEGNVKFRLHASRVCGYQISWIVSM